jgi:hypothetical protein
MDLKRIETKLAEAAFFLEKLKEEDKEPITKIDVLGYSVSAFQNACNTVGNWLCHDHKEIYCDWREKWNKALPPGKDDFMKDMATDRGAEVHGQGSGRRQGSENVDLPIGEHKFKTATLTVGGMPGSVMNLGRETFYLEVGGRDHLVRDACAEHLALLQKMVADFGAAQS